MRLSSILIILLFIFLSANSNAQDKQNIEHTFLSKAFETERTVRVFLPERYFRDSTSTFIVVYVLDAHDDQVWNMAKGNIDYAVSRYTVIPMIAVGIASENRGKEFNPNSETLHKHFKEEVFPLIESKYRVQQHRTIIGHSWGGAFVGNTIFSDKSEMFDAYLALSPSFATNKNIIFNQADSLFRLKKDFKKFLYYSSGSVGFEDIFKNHVIKMDSLLTLYKPKNLAWASQFFDGKDHFSALSPAVNDGLVKMSRNYFADQKTMEDFAQNKEQTIKEQMDDFYAKKKEQFGFTFKPSSSYYRFTGDEFRDKDQYDNAIEIYKLGLELDDNDMKILFNLADTYDKKGEFKSAQILFNKSLSLLEEQKDTVDANYYKNIKEWATKKLEEYKK